MSDIFSAKAPKVMADLCRDFDLSVEDAAAILGNIGHECAGFAKLQEIRPVIPGSRGGFGWAQWTGPRRVAFETWCKRKGLEPSSDRANYSFLFRELKGYEDEPALKAIKAVKAASGLSDKVIAFERAFLRAGIKHYDSRLKWAQKALAAWNAGYVPPPPDIEPVDEKNAPDAKVKLLLGAIVAALAALATYLGYDIKELLP